MRSMHSMRGGIIFRSRGPSLKMYEQRIQGGHMGGYTHGQTAYVNTNKNRAEIVIEHVHTDRNTCNTLTQFVVQRKIVGSGRFERFVVAKFRCQLRVIPIHFDTIHTQFSDRNAAQGHVHEHSYSHVRGTYIQTHTNTHVYMS
jgi:hypothetical protein